MSLFWPRSGVSARSSPVDTDVVRQNVDICKVASDRHKRTAHATTFLTVEESPLISRKKTEQGLLPNASIYQQISRASRSTTKGASPSDISLSSKARPLATHNLSSCDLLRQPSTSLQYSSISPHPRSSSKSGDNTSSSRYHFDHQYSASSIHDNTKIQRVTSFPRLQIRDTLKSRYRTLTQTSPLIRDPSYERPVRYLRRARHRKTYREQTLAEEGITESSQVDLDVLSSDEFEELLDIRLWPVPLRVDTQEDLIQSRTCTRPLIQASDASFRIMAYEDHSVSPSSGFDEDILASEHHNVSPISNPRVSTRRLYENLSDAIHHFNSQRIASGASTVISHSESSTSTNSGFTQPSTPGGSRHGCLSDPFQFAADLDPTLPRYETVSSRPIIQIVPAADDTIDSIIDDYTNEADHHSSPNAISDKSGKRASFMTIEELKALMEQAEFDDDMQIQQSDTATNDHLNHNLSTIFEVTTPRTGATISDPPSFCSSAISNVLGSAESSGPAQKTLSQAKESSRSAAEDALTSSELNIPRMYQPLMFDSPYISDYTSTNIRNGEGGTLKTPSTGILFAKNCEGHDGLPDQETGHITVHSLTDSESDIVQPLNISEDENIVCNERAVRDRREAVATLALSTNARRVAARHALNQDTISLSSTKANHLEPHRFPGSTPPGVWTGSSLRKNTITRNATRDCSVDDRFHLIVPKPSFASESSWESFTTSTPRVFEGKQASGSQSEIMEAPDRSFTPMRSPYLVQENSPQPAYGLRHSYIIHDLARSKYAGLPTDMRSVGSLGDSLKTNSWASDVSVPKGVNKTHSHFLYEMEQIHTNQSCLDDTVESRPSYETCDSGYFDHEHAAINTARFSMFGITSMLKPVLNIRSGRHRSRELLVKCRREDNDLEYGAIPPATGLGIDLSGLGDNTLKIPEPVADPHSVRARQAEYLELPSGICHRSLGLPLTFFPDRPPSQYRLTAEAIKHHAFHGDKLGGDDGHQYTYTSTTSETPTHLKPSSLMDQQSATMSGRYPRSKGVVQINDSTSHRRVVSEDYEDIQLAELEPERTTSSTPTKQLPTSEYNRRMLQRSAHWSDGRPSSKTYYFQGDNIYHRDENRHGSRERLVYDRLPFRDIHNYSQPDGSVEQKAGERFAWLALAACSVTLFLLPLYMSGKFNPLWVWIAQNDWAVPTKKHYRWAKYVAYAWLFGLAIAIIITSIRLALWFRT